MKHGRSALALMFLVMGWLAAFDAQAQSRQCPPNAHRDGEDDKHWYCTCNAGFKAKDGACVAVARNPVVPDLARDSHAACLAAAQLRTVDNRIAGLKKSIALLSSANPEWDRQRERLLEEMHESRRDLSMEATNFVTLGMAEWAKHAAGLRVSDLEKAASALREPLARLPAEAERVNSIMMTTTDGRLKNAMRNYASVAQRLSEARGGKQVVDAAARTRDMADAMRTEFEVMKEHPQPQKIADRLYWSSALLGTIAIVFVAEGPAAVAAAVGSAGASVLVGGREAINLWKEHEQLAALDSNASDRNRMRVELNGRLADLQQQRGRIAGVIQRSGPATNCRF